MTTTHAGHAPARRLRMMNGRTAVGVAVAVLLVVWILVNRNSVDVSFLLWSAQVPLWLALSVAGLLGATAGFLLGRRRYRGTRRRT